MTPIRVRNCSIIGYPILPFGFLSITIIAAITCYYTWPTSISPFFPKHQPEDFLPEQPEHSEVEEVRHVRIAIEEAGGSLSFYLLEQLDAALTIILLLISGFHEEVFGALIYSALQIPGAEVDFYRNHGFRYRFGDILSTFYDKPAKRLDALYDDLAIDEDDSRIDVLISTTCSSHLSSAGQRLLNAYATRKNKFKLFCVIHHAHNMQNMETLLRPWALNGSLSFIGLSSQ